MQARLGEAARELRELAEAFDLSPAMVRSIDGRILRWGRGLQTLLGWTSGEAVGRIAHDLLATGPRAQLDEAIALLMRQGEWQGELTHRHRDGHSVVMATRWALHRGPDGAALSVLDIGQDVTEQRWAVAMLEEREARLRSVLETAPDAIITIDDKGVIQSFSQAAERMFGYAAGEVIGRNVNVLMNADHRRRHGGYLERYLRTGEARIIGIGRQVEARDKAGRVFPIELAVGEALPGAVRIFTGFIRDISLRTRMEQDLRQAQKMEAIGQLTGGLAHDFNNLLTVIQGNLELLEARLDAPGPRELVKDALEATELGAQLSRRLLAFGRRQSLDPKPVDVNALVAGMTELLRRTLGKAVQVETRLTEGLPITLADPGQVENALLNLAINARDAMPDGGTITIATANLEVAPPAAGDLPPGQYVRLTVRDTGTGMSPEVLARAVEPFFTTKMPGQGSGLGLSQVHGLVHQSGGTLAIRSEENRGTTVEVDLPRAPGAPRGEAEYPGPGV
jgi:PAS domain S-box-containing protein